MDDIDQLKALRDQAQARIAEAQARIEAAKKALEESIDGKMVTTLDALIADLENSVSTQPAETAPDLEEFFPAPTEVESPPHPADEDIHISPLIPEPIPLFEETPPATEEAEAVEIPHAVHQEPEEAPVMEEPEIVYPEPDPEPMVEEQIVVEEVVPESESYPPASEEVAAEPEPTPMSPTEEIASLASTPIEELYNFPKGPETIHESAETAPEPEPEPSPEPQNMSEESPQIVGVVKEVQRKTPTAPITASPTADLPTLLDVTVNETPALES